MYFRIVPVGDAAADQQECIAMMDSAVEKLTGLIHSSSNNAVYLSTYCRNSEVWTSILRKHRINVISAPEIHEQNAHGQSIDSTATREQIVATDLADLILAFWDEDPDGPECGIWQTLHRSIEKNIPCFWVSKKSQKCYWATEALYQEASEDSLKEYIDQFSKKADRDELPQGNTWMQKLFLWFYGRYSLLLKRFTPESSFEKYPDTMLESSAGMSDPSAENTRQKLIRLYQKYDSRAAEFSKYYRGSVYFRAWLPLFATIALAIGFYGDTFIKLFGDFPRAKVIIPSLFYLINALLLLFSYYFSKATNNRKWHESFLRNRITSEVLRFFVHVIPYGITLPIKSILLQCGFSENQKAAEISEIRSALSEVIDEYPDYHEDNAAEYLTRLSDYLSNQKEYHSTSAKRYNALYAHLVKIQHRIMFLGPSILIIRGILQLFWGIFLTINDQNQIVPILKTLTNSFAMLIPSLAGYFAAKGALLGLRDGFIKDQMMIERLDKAIAIVNATKSHELNYSMVRNLTERIGILLLSNVSAWEEEMSEKVVTPLC